MVKKQFNNLCEETFEKIKASLLFKRNVVKFELRCLNDILLENSLSTEKLLISKRSKIIFILVELTSCE